MKLEAIELAQRQVIKIGGIDYDYTEVEDLGETEDGETIGNISYRDAEIQIKAGLKPQVKAVTVLHEVIHGIMAHGGALEQDESFIDMLAYGLHQVLKDNPTLVRLINEQV